MLSPDFLESLPAELVKLMEELEDRVLADICERIANNDALSGTAINEIKVLRTQGLDMAKIQKEIKRISGLSQKEVDRIFDAAIAEAKEFDDKISTLADMFPSQDAQRLLAAETEAIRAQIKDDVFNLTQSMGFAMQRGGKTVYMPIAEAYQAALNEAVYGVRAGAVSYNVAVKNAVTKLADSGLRIQRLEALVTE